MTSLLVAAAEPTTPAPAATQPGTLAGPFKWKSSGVLIKPVSDDTHRLVSVKDPTVVYYGDKWHIYATTANDRGTWSMVYLSFKDWSEAANAKPHYLDTNPNLRGYHCAPQVFYFRPHKKWYLIYQSQQPQYSTTDDITRPETWSKPEDFFASKPPGAPRVWIDYWVICDDTHAYLFFTGDDGKFYRSRTKIEDFPKGMSHPEIALQETRDILFEASMTYRIKGTRTYLTLIEALSPDRYYRAFTSDRLDGQWTPLPEADTYRKPFAGINNVVFEQGVIPWTRDISHGELIRDGYDETMTIDVKNLQVLFQGRDPTIRTNYGLLPYRLGLLKLIQAAQGDDSGNLARNPIIWADVPDLAAIRVGDTYYMSSTTMHMSPGLPIMKSRDLVNWQIVGYAYSTLGDNDALTLQNGKNAYGAGSWASSLRHHDGAFYATTFSNTTGKTHVYRTRDIEKGPWTENAFRPALHDHTLFFDDDGRVYMIYGGGNLRLVELTADVSGIKPGGVNQVIITNASRVAGPNVGLPAEGSQMRKINGTYYLFNITWPRGGMRTVLVHRADSIAGPYEGRVALRDNGVAQGGLIDTPQGDWYAYLFRDYGAVGRIPYLVPVKWEDGWPVLGVDGRVPDTLPLPAGKGLIPGIVASDEFNRRTGDPALPPAWQWNHNPDDANWSLTRRPGFLRLTTGRVDGDFLSARNTLTQRTFGPECSGTVCIDVGNMKDGDFAGLGVLQKQYGLVGVKMAGNARSIVMVSAERGPPVEVESAPLSQDVVYLKVECDFRNRADRARFFHSIDGKQWTVIGKPLRMAYTLPHFMGYRFALLNYATKTAGGFVDFDYFRVSDRVQRQRPRRTGERSVK